MYVHATDSVPDLCSESTNDTMNIEVYDINKFLAFRDTAICEGDTAYLYTTGGTRYSWKPNNNISDTAATGVKVWPRTSAAYSVTIMNDRGCAAERTLNVTVNPLPNADAGPDVELKYGEREQLHASGGSQYSWSPDYNLAPRTGADPYVWPDSTTMYYVTVASSAGCQASDSVLVKVLNVFLPSAFSPNGDGRNDVFRLIVNNPSVKLLQMRIYNRWGEQVFYSTDSRQGWNGSFKGMPAEIGTYFYMIDYVIGHRQYNLKGDVTLVR